MLVYTFIPIFIVVADELQQAPERAVEDLQVRTASPSTTGCTRAPTRACATRSRRASRSVCWRPSAPRSSARWRRSRWSGTSSSGRSATNVLIFLPMAAPEIVMGSSLLALFVAAGFAGQLGFWTILIAHIMFCLSFVVVTVRPDWRASATRSNRRRWTSTPRRSRRSGGSPSRWSSPASWARRCSRFSLSFDDFIITNLNAGTTTTFPMYVWGVSRSDDPDADQRRRHRDADRSRC